MAVVRPDPHNSCSAVKVGQLDRALVGKDAWLSGLRRSEAASRSAAPVVGRDIRGLMKVNPIANWTDVQLADSTVEHDLPVHPLTHQGYTSIGCAPCTQLPTDPGDPSSGRWAGQARTECGLHDR